MRSGCITQVRFNMKCDILKPLGAPETVNSDGVETGVWQYEQDEDSGAIVKVWIDNLDTAEVNENELIPGVIKDAPVLAHGIIDGGIRVSGTTERFAARLDQVDYVQATFPSAVNITLRDKVTNIRNKWNEVIWKEEQMNGMPPTVFNVMGVIPTMDPFGRIMDAQVLLQRAEVQGN